MTGLDRRSFVAGSVALGLARPAAALAASPPSATWQRLPTEPYKGKQDDIAFVTPDLGWYGNGAGKLYRTTDGGRTWSGIWEQPGTFIRALGFVDAMRGFLGNVGTDYYPGVTDTHPLYRTRDGGATWTPVDAPGIAAVKGICGIDILPRRTIYQGSLRDAAVIHAAGRVGGPAALLRSTDGGETFAVHDVSAHAGMILDVHFHDADTGLLCTSTDADPEKGEAQILLTRDGARTWTPVYRSGRKSENSWKMSFPTPRIGYATVQSYDPAALHRVIVKTVDGGRTWRERALVDDAKGQEFGIGFTDARRGWIGTASGGHETRDGGATWQRIEFGRAVNKIRVVGEGAARRAFAIGVEVHRLDLG